MFCISLPFNVMFLRFIYAVYVNMCISLFIDACIYILYDDAYMYICTLNTWYLIHDIMTHIMMNIYIYTPHVYVIDAYVYHRYRCICTCPTLSWQDIFYMYTCKYIYVLCLIELHWVCIYLSSLSSLQGNNNIHM